jgi:hypothetical protein
MSVHGTTVTGQVELNHNTLAVLEINTHSNTAFAPAVIYGARSRGTLAARTIVQSGDTVRYDTAVAFDGVDHEQLGYTSWVVDGTPGADDMPGRWVLATTADGAFTPTERLRVTAAGGWGLSGANYGTAGQVLSSNGNAPPTWIDSTAGLTAEQVSDLILAQVVGSASITATPNDGADTVTLSIPTAGVTMAMQADLAGLSVSGRSANTTGVQAAITGTDGQALRVSGTALGFGTIATAGIADNAVTFAKMQAITAERLLGANGGTVVEEISVGAGLSLASNALAVAGDFAAQHTNTLQPAFEATSGLVSDVTGDGTAYTIVYDTEVGDQTASFVHTTGIFTTPVAGWYLFTYQLAMTGLASTNTVQVHLANTTDATTYIMTNTRYAASTIPGSGNYTINGSVMCKLGASKAISLVWTGSGATKILDMTASRFTGHLIC